VALGRPGETRREAVLAPYHGVLTVGIVGPLEAFEGDLEVGNCVRIGLEALGLDAPHESLDAMHSVAAGGADSGRARYHADRPGKTATELRWPGCVPQAHSGRRVVAKARTIGCIFILFLSPARPVRGFSSLRRRANRRGPLGLADIIVRTRAPFGSECQDERVVEETSGPGGRLALSLGVLIEPTTS